MIEPCHAILTCAETQLDYRWEDWSGIPATPHQPAHHDDGDEELDDHQEPEPTAHHYAGPPKYKPYNPHPHSDDEDEELHHPTSPYTPHHEESEDLQSNHGNHQASPYPVYAHHDEEEEEHDDQAHEIYDPTHSSSPYSYYTHPDEEEEEEEEEHFPIHDENHSTPADDHHTPGHHSPYAEFYAMEEEEDHMTADPDHMDPVMLPEYLK